MTKLFVIISILLACLAISSAESESLARGFNENINWRTFEDGQKESQETGKPLLLLIHKSWCGACKRLKGVVGPSTLIEERSKAFVMVNVEDEEEPKGAQFSPDGGYIPRILFLEPNGNVRDDLINEKGNPKYKYYYAAEDQMLASMDHALEVLKPGKNEIKLAQKEL